MQISVAKISAVQCYFMDRAANPLHLLWINWILALMCIFRGFSQLFLASSLLYHSTWFVKKGICLYLCFSLGWSELRWSSTEPVVQLSQCTIIMVSCFNTSYSLCLHNLQTLEMIVGHLWSVLKSLCEFWQLHGKFKERLSSIKVVLLSVILLHLS